MYKHMPEPFQVPLFHKQYPPRTRQTANDEVILGLGALRVFLPQAGFADLVDTLASRCSQGELAAALESLNCLYGDL